MQGYWQGTLEVGAPERHGKQPKARRFKIQLVYNHGRRLAPPDTTLAADRRHAVVWETISAQTTAPGVGRFCEVLSFNSRARIALSDVSGVYPSDMRGHVVHTAGRVCGLFNRTGGEMKLAWSTRGGGTYPEGFEATESTQVASLTLLSEDVYPSELEGQWSGRQLRHSTKESETSPRIIQVQPWLSSQDMDW
eukprot:scaffold247927_cov36-Prasinocladus_malaysianus.AAC.1